MKKNLLLLLSSLFLLAGCASNEAYTPSHGGTYDPEHDKPVVTPTVTGLGFVSAPEKINVGETLSKDDVSVLVNYSDNNIKQEHPDSVSLDTSSPGKTQGQVVYSEFTAAFDIEVVSGVNPPTPEKEVSSLGKVTAPEKITVGAVLGLDEVLVVVNYSDGTSGEVHPTSLSIDTSEAKTVEASVSYGGKTTTFSIVVEAKDPSVTITSLGEVSAPTKVLLNGEVLASEVTVVVIYSDNTTSKVHPESVSLDTSSVGEKTGTVTYKGFNANFTISVENEVTLKEITKVLLPPEIYQDDVLTADKVTLTVTYSDDSVQNVHPESNADITYDTSKVGAASGSVKYKGLTATFNYEVLEKEEEEEEDIIYCTYNIYFSYSHTTTTGAKKDVDNPLITFTAPMLSPLGKAPEAIRSTSDETKVDAAKFKALGESKGYVVDPAFPTFIGLSYHGLCLTDDDLWDFSKDFKQVAVVTLYGIWVSE